MDAMGEFIDFLQTHPGHAMTHRYMEAITQELAAEKSALARRDRLAMLQDVSVRLPPPQQSPALRQAVEALDGKPEHQQELRWNAWLQKARADQELGHLLGANAFTLQVLTENPNHTEAVRLLSEIQSDTRAALDAGHFMVMEERYVLEGFYYYGQADYEQAAASWAKARAVLNAVPARASEARIRSLYFEPYEKLSAAHLAERRRQEELKSMFAQAVAAYQKEKFEEALHGFRQLALKEPEYPQLAFYLVQAELGAERSRAKRLGEDKRREIVTFYEKGLQDLEAERFADAEKAFARVLALDPSHTQAKSYLAMAKAENQRRHDPKAAQLHYEAGLIAYASGKLDEAMREWSLAARMNPEHQKVQVALAKVKKELALYKELPELR